LKNFMSLRRSYIQHYVKHARHIQPYAYWCILIFVAATITGSAGTILYPDVTDTLLNQFSVFARNVLDRQQWQILLFIFFNNSVKSLAVVLLGIVFGIIPLLFIAANGYMVGMIATIIAQEEGMMSVLAGIIPHGVLELPAVIVAASLGISIGSCAWHKIRGRPVSLKKAFISNMRFFVVWVLPLLLGAALIEVYLTPLILSAVS